MAIESSSLINEDAKIEADGVQSYGSVVEKTQLNFVSNQIGISWHNLTVTHSKTEKPILTNVSGFAKPGEFIALMGSSGAGKTTLLHTLLSRNLKNLEVKGDVLVNGYKLGKDIKYVSGFIHQDELFVPTLTVEEWLIIQANLRLIGFSKEAIHRRVLEIINELGLTGCKHSRIGLAGRKKGISGGEARRLSLATELLNNPSLLFADEPTSGLDSSMAESVINIMKKLSKAGRTIICTIHQPSSTIYRKFDRVIFLAKGRLAYFGEPSNSVEFLKSQGYPCPSNWNPADALIQTLSIQSFNDNACLDRIKKISDGFHDSSEGIEFQNVVEECRAEQPNLEIKQNTASCFVQTKNLFKRSFIDNLRNPGLARAKIIQKVIMGLFIGFLYLQTQLDTVGINNLNGAMYYIVAELTYSTLFGILTVLPNEFPLLVREYNDGLYSVLSYYLAKSASYVPLFALDGLLMVSIAYWMTGLTQTLQRFAFALLIGLLVEQSAAAFGVMLSALSPSYPVAISIAGPLVTVISLTGGFFANAGELPNYIAWVQYISWFRYGFEAFSISQWEGAFSEDDNNTISTSTPYSSPQSILEKYSFSAGMFYTDIFMLLILILVFYAVGFIGLLIRAKRSR